MIALCALAVPGCSDSGSSGASTTSVTAPTSVASNTTTPLLAGTQATDSATTIVSEIEITTDQAQEALAATTFADPTTIGRIELYKESPAMVDAAAAAAKSTPTGARKWAAVYVLANADAHATDLARFLTDTDITIRVMAAIGTIGQGDSAGFPVLVDALAVDQPMVAFDPPMPAWEAASIALARHTAQTLGPAFDADPTDRLDSQRRWRDWWTAGATELHFDEATELWSGA